MAYFFFLQFVDLIYKNQFSWSVETSEQTVVLIKSILLLLFVIGL